LLAQFVRANPFANAPDAATLRSQVLAGLPAPLLQALQLGLTDPASTRNPDSSYSRAVAALDPAVLASGARQLLANTLQVAGASTDSLRASGSLTGPGSPYAKELNALAQAFSPASTAGLNDLQMAYNQITVNGSGSLAIFAPQGSVIVGQASPPVLDFSAAQKKPFQLGIFTIGGGDIIGMARDNFNVFQSRVFTVAGGDIDLWSSLGNIDAGKGPRDVAIAAPPTLVVDPTTGIEYLNFNASVTGSGIGALVTQPDQPPSNINLMAPAGYVDAGEAGIRAQGGTVTLGTNLVLNAGNISAAGGVSGGAVVALAPTPPPPSTTNSSGDKVAGETQRDAIAQQLAAEQRGLEHRLQVVGEFLQFEADSCKDAPDGEECKASRTERE
jgi:hypothetical protein